MLEDNILGRGGNIVVLNALSYFRLFFFLYIGAYSGSNINPAIKLKLPIYYYIYIKQLISKQA